MSSLGNSGEILNNSEEEDNTGTCNEVINYLMSNNGNALANKVINLIQQTKDTKAQLQKETIEFRKKANKHFQLIRAIILISCIVAVTILIFYNKFDSAPALFFGAIVAYLFGKELR